MQTILLLRHGRTAGNERRAFIGRTDESLTAKGRAALTPLAAVDAVFASPLARCRETAACCFPEQEIKIVSALREMDFGEFEGKTHQELVGLEGYQQWLACGGQTTLHGGELVSIFHARAWAGFREVLAQSVGLKNIALVTHGGCIMAMMASLTDTDFYNWTVGNGAGYCFSYDTDLQKIGIIKRVGGV